MLTPLLRILVKIATFVAIVSTMVVIWEIVELKLR
jgi:hypothetical protein